MKKLLKKVLASAVVLSLAFAYTACAKESSEFKYGHIDIPGLDGSLCGDS